MTMPKGWKPPSSSSSTMSESSSRSKIHSEGKSMTSPDELHDAAVGVIKEFLYEGKPFILYLRKFNFDLLHGKNEIDRYLIDNYIMTNLPQGINVITIQEADNQISRIEGTAFFRDVPV